MVRTTYNLHNLQPTVLEYDFGHGPLPHVYRRLRKRVPAQRTAGADGDGGGTGHTVPRETSERALAPLRSTRWTVAGETNRRIQAVHLTKREEEWMEGERMESEGSAGKTGLQ